MKHAGVRSWWFVVVAVTLFAGCHGGGGSSLSSLPPSTSGLPGAPRYAMSAPANPVATITPATVCTQTYAGNNYDKGTEYSCWLQGGATSQTLTLSPVEDIPGTHWLCRNRSFEFIDGGSDSDPPSPLPSPTVVFDPAQHPDGYCTDLNSTTITFTFPSPIPQKRWADRWIVAEDFQYNGGDGVWHGNFQTIAELWLHPGLRIVDNDKLDELSHPVEIENQTWERVVGQRVNIAAVEPWNNETISGCSWNVPNGVAPYAVGSYANLSGSTPPSVVGSPAPMPSTSAAPLTYYWAQPFDASQQNVTCSVSATNFGGNGEGGYAVPATSISAVLTPYVVAPTASVSTTFGTVSQGPYAPNSSNREQVTFGDELNMPSSLGLQATYTVTMPADYAGYFGPNQTVNATTTVSPQPSSTPATTGGAVWLDNCIIYPNYYNPSTQVINGPQSVPWLGKGVEGSYSMADTPGSVNYWGSSSIQENDSLVTTLLFKPNIGPDGSTLSNTIWVPLASYSWSLSATAVNDGSNNWSWLSTPTQSPAAGTYTTSGNPTMFSIPGNFPTWSGRVTGADCAATTP